MKTFRELFIHLNGFPMEALAERMTQLCTGHWRRRPDREKEIALFGDVAYSFEYRAEDDLERAGLSLFQKEGDIWHVPNIVPLEVGQLSVDQYNRILSNFFVGIVQPAIKNTPVTGELTEDTISVRDVAGEEVDTLLKRFSSIANKSTGSAHPMDRKRWFDFILKAYKTGSRVDTGLLVGTLLEQGWPVDAAHELAEEYELAMDLLEYESAQ